MNAQVKRWTTGLATLVIVLTVTLMTLGAAPWSSSASPLAPTAAEVEPNDEFATANHIRYSGNYDRRNRSSLAMRITSDSPRA